MTGCLTKRRSVSVILLSALALTVSCGGGDSDESARWAALPRTVSCAVEPAGGTVQDVPPSLQVEQVTLSDEGGQRLAIALEFPGGVPPDPTAVNGPYGVRSAPGSVSLSILVLPTDSQDEDPYLVIDSPEPATGRSWNAEVVSGDTDANALQSATISGTTRTLVVDLRNHAGALGSGKFKADVHIIMTVSQTPPTMPIILSAQHCDWDRPISASTSAAKPTASQPPISQRSRPPSAAAPASPGHMFTIADYIKQNGIIETPVTESGGPPGAPVLHLPLPAGWTDSHNTPSYAYGQIVPTDPALVSDPPTITAIFSRLTGNVDADAVLKYAPGEVQNLPGFKTNESPKRGMQSGFEAVTVAGAYAKDGASRVIVQKTVVVPGKDGLYVLQINADWAVNRLQTETMKTALQLIRAKTTITP